MRPTILALPLMALGAAPAAAESADVLRARLEAVAGRPVALDPRLVSTPCPEPHAIGWRGAPGQSLVLSCPAIGRRLVVPVAGHGPVGVSSQVRRDILVRRGDRVVVEAEGSGFRVSTEAVAEGAAGAGERLVLRNAASGQRFQGIVGPDGRITVAIR
jgi:hypothetical protein